MADFVTLTTPPILVGPNDEPAQGRLYARVSRMFPLAGKLVVPFSGSGLIVNGMFTDNDGLAYKLPVTPEGAAIELIAELFQDGPGRNTSHIIRRHVAVPDQATITWDGLIDVVPAAVVTDYVRPPWAAELDAKAELALEAANTAIALVGSIPLVAAGPGIDYTGVTDSTAALQAFINSLPDRSEINLLPGALRTSSPLVFPNQVTLRGGGGAIGGAGELVTERTVTAFIFSHPTADCLVFEGAGNTLRDFAVIHTGSAPSAGAGIRLKKATNGSMSGVTVLGFSTLVWSDGVYWNMSGCWLYDPAKYGLHVSNTASDYTDHGDFGIVNNVISAMYREYEAIAGVQWESGGGIRFVGNKINAAAQPGNPSTRRFEYGLYFNSRNDVQTGDLVIDGNSIANCSKAMVRITQTGNGYFGYVNVTGNQINVGDDTCVGIHVGAQDVSHFQNIRDVHVGGNVFHDFPGSSVIVDYAANIDIGRNVHKNVGSPVIRLGTGVQSAVPIGASVASQSVAGDDVTLIEDWRSHGVDSPREGTMTHDYQRAWHETTINNDQTMFRVGAMQDGAIIATIRISGYGWDFGNRQFAIEEKKFFSRQGGGSMNHTTIGTRVNMGNGAADIAITYDCPWEGPNAGQCLIKVRVTNATFPNVDAEVQVTLQGGVQIVHKGN